MSELSDALASVKAKILRYGSQSINEENTKSALIQPVLRALGWDVESLEEVELEYKPRRSDKPVDYALLLLRTPCLFVEAKALGQSLDDRKWAGQLMGYAGVAGVEWVALTNGDEYRLYNAHAAVPVEEKLFRRVKVTEDEATAVETLRLLSKESLGENQIKNIWNAHFVDRHVRLAVEEMFSATPDPDARLVGLIKKRVGKLSSRDIKASLRRLRIQLDFPEEVSREVASPEAKGSRAARRARGARRKRDDTAGRKKKAFVDVSLQDLISEGLLKPPMKLSRHYKDRDLEATLHKDGTIEFQGARYTSCSTAASEARRTVTGGKPSTNGWAFWQFRDGDGRLVALNAVRKELLAKRVVPLERARRSAGDQSA